jgi:uncharacterized protein (TIGR02266 family)
MSENSTPTTGQQRKSLRAPLIVLNIISEDGSRSFFGYGRNISRGGLFIASINPRDPGTRFKLEIPLPSPINRIVRCQCEVVWNRRFDPKSPYDPGMGLRFIDMPEETAELIDSWVRQQGE